MQIIESWSVPDERIRDFFRGQMDVLQSEENRFSFGGCAICLTPLPPRRVGRFLFPQTRVEFSGPEEETERIHRRFMLQFLSGGG